MTRKLSPEKLRTIRRDAVGAKDPRARLRALKLGTQHWSALLEDAVRNARKSGLTWEEIAKELDVTTQAAHKRFRVKTVSE